MASKLEESPEFQAALNEACEKQYTGWLYGGSAVKAETKSQISDVMKKIQQNKREAEKMRESLALRATARDFNITDIPKLPDEITPESMATYHKGMQAYTRKTWAEVERRTNIHVREIDAIYKRKYGSKSSLVCPLCGEGDHGNRTQGKPVCLMNWKHKGRGVDGPVPLMTPEKAKEWKPPEKPKTKSFTFKEPDGVVRV